jgi:signal transduction histidine kinase
MSRDRLFDILTMGGATALILVTVFGPPPNMAYTSAGVVVEVAVVGALIFRRRASLPVVWITTVTAAAMTLVELLAPGTLINTAVDVSTLWIPQAAVPFAVCGALSYARDQRAAWTPIAILLVLAIRPWEFSGLRIAQTVVIIVIPAVFGLYIAARQRVLDGLIERAKAGERTRLAAEMHDMITHRVSLMVLQAGGLEMTARDEATRIAAEQLRANGCQALAELRDLVAILRESGLPEDVTGQVTDAPVPEFGTLVAESIAVGVPVDLVEQGASAQASPVVRRTAHRIIQEALTNVRKHSPGSHVQVRVRYGEEDMRVSVHNNAPTKPPDPVLTDAGSGSGLDNLRERVSLIGGTLDAGPASEGGFRVEATLPTLKEPAR